MIHRALTKSLHSIAISCSTAINIGWNILITISEHQNMWMVIVSVNYLCRCSTMLCNTIGHGIVVGFTQTQIGQQPQKFLVKNHDPCVGHDAEAVPIEPVTAKFYGQEGVTYSTKDSTTFYFPVGLLLFTKYKGYLLMLL